jgi:hypothetical protein
VSVKVVTEDELKPVLARLGELEQQVKDLAGGSRAKARAYLTPVEVAKRHGVRHAIVYEALESGKLAAEKRPHPRGTAYRIQPADAQRWYDAHVRAGDNQ